MKKYIIGFILGALICGSITGVLAYALNARDIEYKPTWKAQDGSNIENVEQAIGELYDLSQNTNTQVYETG